MGNTSGSGSGGRGVKGGISQSYSSSPPPPGSGSGSGLPPPPSSPPPGSGLVGGFVGCAKLILCHVDLRLTYQMTPLLAVITDALLPAGALTVSEVLLRFKLTVLIVSLVRFLKKMLPEPFPFTVTLCMLS